MANICPGTSSWTWRGTSRGQAKVSSGGHAPQGRSARGRPGPASAFFQKGTQQQNREQSTSAAKEQRGIVYGRERAKLGQTLSFLIFTRFAGWEFASLCSRGNLTFWLKCQVFSEFCAPKSCVSDSRKMSFASQVSDFRVSDFTVRSRSKKLATFYTQNLREHEKKEIHFHVRRTCLPRAASPHHVLHTSCRAFLHRIPETSVLT